MTKKEEGNFMEANLKLILNENENILDITKKAEYKVKEVVTIKIGNFDF